MAQKQVSIKITSDSSKAKKEIDGLAGKLKSLQKTLSSSSMANLGASITGLGTAFSAVKSAVGAVVDAMGECNEAYKAQVNAERSLEVAAANNPYLNKGSVDALKKYAGELQAVSNYGDEQLIPMMTRLAASGRTQQQIMDIMGASVDMAASGAMGLEEAVSALNKTYAGTAGRLSELSPKLKDLTQDQLKSGEAVKLLSQQFKGMAAQTADSSVQMKNALGDFKEELGAVVNGPMEDMQKSATGVLTTITKWFANIRHYREAEAEAVEEARRLAGNYETVEEKEKRLKQEAKERAKAEKEARKEAEAAAKVRAAGADEYAKRTAEQNLLLEYGEEKYKKLVTYAEAFSDRIYTAQGNQEELNTIVSDVARSLGVSVDNAKKFLAVTGDISAKAAGMADEYYRASYYNSMIQGYRDKAAADEAKQAEAARKRQEDEAKRQRQAASRASAAPRQRTQDDARAEYDKAIQAAQREIDIRRSLGEDISAEAEAQQMLNTATSAYVKMLSDPVFKSGNGGQHEAEARAYIERLAGQVSDGAAREAWEAAVEFTMDEAEKIRAEFSKQLEEFDRAYTDFINTLPEGSEERLAAEKTFTDGVIKLHEEMEAKLRELDDKSEEAARRSAEEKAKAFAETVRVISECASQMSQIIGDASNLMLQYVQNESELEQAELKEKYENGELSEEEYQQKVTESKKKAAREEYRIQMVQWGASLLQATANIAQGVTKAIADNGYPLGAIMGGLAAAAGAVEIASIVASKPIPPRFAKGGFVPGKSYTGDRVTARVNSGEAVLTAAQQRNFMALANGKNGGGGSGAQINVTNNAANLVSATPSFDGKAVSILIEQKVNEGLQKGKFNKSLVIANQSMTGKGYGV